MAMPTDPSLRVVVARCLCLAVAAAIVFELFTMSVRPAAAGLIAAPWDKVAHFAVYSAIAALLWVAAAGRMRVALLFIVIALGLLDELHQAAVPGRTADAMDFLADTCAAAATIGLLALKEHGPGRTTRKGQPCAA
jgi:VanZ family protein